MTIAPVRFGMPLSERAQFHIRHQRATESIRLDEQDKALTEEFETRFAEAETLERLDRSLERLHAPRNGRWSDDEYRFREYVKIETELLEKRDGLTIDENLTQREVRDTLAVLNKLIDKANAREKELMQGFSIAALDRMTGWLAGNARFRTQSDEALAQHFRARYNARG